MTDEPNGFKLPQELVLKIIGTLIAALLGTNLYTGVTSQRELTREQASWDTKVAEIIMAKLDRIEATLNAANKP